MANEYDFCLFGDEECDGPLAKPNRPCCQRCADTYEQLVAQGKTPDFMSLSGYIPGQVAVEIIETQEDLVETEGDILPKVWN